MAFYIPVDQRGPEYPIFYPLYQCNVNPQAIRSVEHIRQYGTYSSGDPQIDRAMSTNTGSFWLTIAQIATHVNNGVEVRIARQQDTRKIYDDLTAYLEYRAEFLRQQLRIKNQQLVDDLICLDNLRLKLYPFAKPFFPKTATGSDLVDLAQQHAALAMPLEAPPTNNQPEATEEDGPESMADIFAQYRYGSGSFETRDKRWS